MTWFEAEQRIIRHKEETQRAVENYHPQVKKQPGLVRTGYHQFLALAGGYMISTGTRLQVKYERLTASGIDLPEPLALSRNGAGDC